MAANQNWNIIGEQIRDAVQESLSTGDFKQLNDIIAGTVSSAVSEVKRQAGQSPKVNSTTRSARPQNQNNNVRAQTPKTGFMTTIRTKKVGNVSGILLIVFGGIGTGIAAIVAFSLLIYFLTGHSLVPFLWAGAFLAGFIFMIERGCMRRNRLKRADRYVELCGGKSYIDIEDLAMHIGKSKRYVLKDVKKMIKLGIFPEGHLDVQEKCLILNDATFREYLRLQKERKALEMEAKVARMQERQKSSGKLLTQEKNEREELLETQAAQEEEEKIDNPELAAMIKQGNDYIRKLRDMNDRIEGEVISAKLFRLENLLKEIFDRVKEHPEQMPQMQKFMNYYLPTTLKLVEAYAEFDEVSVQGEDIKSAKAEIEKTLDTINQAFVELLNKLFQASVFDVTTDAQVLQTMLAKEGLTREKEFEKLTK